MGRVKEGERGGPPPGGVPFEPVRRPPDEKGGGTNDCALTCGRFDGRLAGDAVDSAGDGVDVCAGAATDGPWKSFDMSLLLSFGAGEGVEVGAVVAGVEADDGAVDEDADGACGRLVMTDFAASPLMDTLPNLVTSLPLFTAGAAAGEEEIGAPALSIEPNVTPEPPERTCEHFYLTKIGRKRMFTCFGGDGCIAGYGDALLYGCSLAERAGTARVVAMCSRTWRVGGRGRGRRG